MPKVALVETKPSKTNFSKDFSFNFDQFQLCSDPTIKKVLKQMYENGVMKDGEEGDQTDSVDEQSDSDQSD